MEESGIAEEDDEEARRDAARLKAIVLATFERLPLPNVDLLELSDLKWRCRICGGILRTLDEATKQHLETRSGEDPGRAVVGPMNRRLPIVVGFSVFAEIAFSVLFASMGRFADAYFVALIALALLALGIFRYAIKRFLETTRSAKAPARPGMNRH